MSAWKPITFKKQQCIMQLTILFQNTAAISYIFHIKDINRFLQDILKFINYFSPTAAFKQSKLFT